MSINASPLRGRRSGLLGVALYEHPLTKNQQGGVMLNDSQQRKALVLSLLMVMLAQTAYTESYRGWTLAEQANPSLLNAGCDGLSRPAGTPIYVDAAQGSDDWSGIWSCPKATLSDALNDSSTGDEIVLATGLYHENVTVNGKDLSLIHI